MAIPKYFVTVNTTYFSFAKMGSLNHEWDMTRPKVWQLQYRNKMAEDIHKSYKDIEAHW
jgi:hypothetical protein